MENAINLRRVIYSAIKTINSKCILLLWMNRLKKDKFLNYINKKIIKIKI
jgi:hypothetical protein